MQFKVIESDKESWGQESRNQSETKLKAAVDTEGAAAILPQRLAVVRLGELVVRTARDDPAAQARDGVVVQRRPSCAGRVDVALELLVARVGHALEAEAVGQLGYAPGVDEDALMDAALEAGAEDLVSNDDGSVDITTPWEDFAAIKEALVEAGFELEGGEVTMVASTTVPVDADGAEKLMGLVDALEELDDVQNVYHNLA